MAMKNSQSSVEQATHALRYGDCETAVEDVCRCLGISQGDVLYLQETIPRAWC
jgi:hypothetical protein